MWKLRHFAMIGLSCGLWACDDDFAVRPQETDPGGDPACSGADGVCPDEAGALPSFEPELPPRDFRPHPRPDLPDPVMVVLRNREGAYLGVDDTYVSSVDHTPVPEAVGNFGGSEELVVFDASVRQALLRFDLAGIPADARIESATLEVFVERLEYASSPELVMHRMTADWDEGTCRSQYECTPDGATWARRGPRLGEWSSPGGDYDDLLAAVPIPEAGGQVRLDLTKQVRRWVRGDQPNHGVLLRGRRSWSNSITLASSESPRAERRPALAIRYRPALAPDAMSGPLSPRVENRTCRLPRLPGGDIALERAWPGLGFDRPVWFGAPPDGSGLNFVAEIGGTLRVFSADRRTRSADVFLQIETVSAATPEQGLLGVAFHPDYARNGRLFVAYSAEGPRRTVLSEWRRDAVNPRMADPVSERVLLEIPKTEEMHNGGDLHFGPDGYLYFATGDGGGNADPEDNARRPSRLLGKILRIDVDAPVGPYGIPADNPFARRPRVRGDDAPARPEVFAYGFRNPWRFGVDRETGEVWVGDVGEESWEEVNLVRSGGFYGWDLREGDECHEQQPADCASEGVEEAVHAYRHDQGRCVIGGRVYRGRALPELQGSYVFGDCDSGQVWAMAVDRSGPRPTVREIKKIGESDFGITSFGEDADGELYVVTYSYGNSLLRIAPRPPEENARPPAPFPQLLSETGCFLSTAGHVPAPGVIPYDVNVELWSDGAAKSRFLALPPGGYVEYDADGAFDVPEDTVLVKSFFTPDGARRLETRLMVRRASSWEGFTYKWNDAGTDAELLDEALEEAVATPEGPLTWHYPSRAQCDACHTQASGGALGLRARQLNRRFDYGRETWNQLEAFEAAGLIVLPDAAHRLPAWPRIDDEGRPVEARARAWIDANCSHCHQPGTSNPMDLRGTTPLAATDTCEVPPRFGDLGVDGAQVLVPGDPDHSVLYLRASRRGAGQMPPLATERPDAPAIDVLRRWIEGLDRCR